jgi:hypothetical protein
MFPAPTEDQIDQPAWPTPPTKVQSADEDLTLEGPTLKVSPATIGPFGPTAPAPTAETTQAGALTPLGETEAMLDEVFRAVGMGKAPAEPTPSPAPEIAVDAVAIDSAVSAAFVAVTGSDPAPIASLAAAKAESAAVAPTYARPPAWT